MARLFSLQGVGIFLIISSFLGVPIQGQDSKTLPPLDITTLVNIALRDNPELRALRNLVEAAYAIPPRVGTLDNPIFGLSLVNLPVGTFSLDQTPVSGVVFNAIQKIPWPGKLSARRRRATFAAEATEWQYRRRAIELIREVKEAVYELFRIEKEIELTRLNKDLLSDLAKVAEARYAVGQGAQQDVLKAQVEVSSMIDELVRLSQARQTALANLNTLLNRPPDTPLGRVPEIVPHDKIPLSLGALMEAAEQTNPRLQMLRAMIEAQEEAVRLAELDLKPDFQVGFQYIVRSRVRGVGFSGPDHYSFLANVIFPLYADRKEKMRIKEEKARLAALQAQLDAAKNDVFFRLKDLYVIIQKLRRQLALYRDGIIPQAEATLAASRADYIVGRVDFLNVLTSLLALYRHQIVYYRLIAEHEKALARLEALIGTRLFE